MPHQWTDYERHVLHIGFGEFELSGGDMEAIFRNIFLNDWTPNNTPTAKRLIDEWTTRGHPSRSNRWQQEIDRSSYTAAQQADRTRARNAIQNARVPLGQVTAQSAVASSTAASQGVPAPPPVAAPAAPATRTNMPQAAGGSRNAAAQAAANISSSSNRQATETQLPLRYLPVNETRPLSMIHSREVTYTRDVPYYTASQGVGPIKKSTKLYQCGGPVVKVFYQDYFDTMICWKEACTYCSGEEIPWIEGMQRKYDAATAAEENEDIAIEATPYKGLPFVHVGRDTVAEDDNVHCFKPKGRPGDVPDETTTAGIVFDNRDRQPMEEENGQRGLRMALVCKEGECDVCAAANA